MNKTINVAPVLNEVQVGEVILRSNKDSTEELIALMDTTLKMESIKEYTTKLKQEKAIPSYTE